MRRGTIAKRRRLLATIEALVCVGYAFFATTGMLHVCQTMLCRQNAHAPQLSFFSIGSLQGTDTTDTARARGPPCRSETS